MRPIRSLTFALTICIAAPWLRAQSNGAVIGAYPNAALPTAANAIVTDGETGEVIPDTNLTFTTIDVPGATITGVQGINTAGDVVGIYAETDLSLPHGFLFRGGNFTYLDYPSAYATSAFSINDSGLIAGYAEFQGGAAELGFLYNGVSFTSIRDGKDGATVCWGINNAGLVVGGAGTVFGTKGFGLRGHTFQSISPPGTYVYGYATGINNLDDVVGWTDYDGFSYTRGKFTTVDFPGADQTEALGINDSGVVVGLYVFGGSTFGFALKGGKYISLSYPGAVETAAHGINASGQIVGAYSLDYNVVHGFVTSPIAPADLPPQQ